MTYCEKPEFKSQVTYRMYRWHIDSAAYRCFSVLRLKVMLSADDSEPLLTDDKVTDRHTYQTSQ